MGFQATDCHRRQSSGFYSWRVFSSVNYNNVYGRWITTQYLRQIKENSKLNNGGFNKWLEILAGKDLRTKLRKSENVDFKFSASNGAAVVHSEGKYCQLETETIQRPRICKEAATKYYSYTANEAGEDRLPMFQQNSVNRIRNETEERQVYTQNYLLRCNDRKQELHHLVKSTRGVSFKRTEDSRSAFSPFYSKLYVTMNSLEHR